jgi:hypothetical protein
MTRKPHTIDHLSAATARQAHSEMAAMQRDLSKLRDSVAGLHQAIHAPKIRPPRLKTKRTVNAPFTVFGMNGGNLLDMGASDLLGAAGLVGGGYTSAAQSAGQNLALIALGQRIR